MYTVIYTKSLENANDMVAKSWEYEKHDDAIALFNEKVNELVNKALSNEFINFKMSMNDHKALIHFESVHHCISVVKDGGIFDECED